MAKKKEECPYCGKMFVYLSRHKCKVKARMEDKENEKSVSERRIERIEERKKELRRNLKKEEKEVLELINKKGNLYFDELAKLNDIERNKLDEIVDILSLQSRIKVRRELVNASWSKHIFAIEEYEEEDADTQGDEVDKSKPDFIWSIFGKQPCFICVFTDQCSDDNPDRYNPHHCPWLSQWIDASIKGEEFVVDFEAIEQSLVED
ncbi:MAG: hypothetical protein GF317_15520 [Candidatus Lokiarchaeota archaeon]|nr:hypothetical protein [Candidatus Lokiarchaeota archaeon]MBD3200972.1 hypothetical protein [Candidatus Lokiarchaeota archaeon]